MRILRTVFLAAALLTSLASVHAQGGMLGSRSTSVGVMAGLSLTAMEGQEAAGDLERLTRMSAGVSVVTSWSPRIQFEVDVMYAGKGFRAPGTGQYYDVATGYLEIPALLRVGLAPYARVHPFLTVGPAFSYQTGCKLHATTATATFSADCQSSLGVVAKMEKVDYSAVVGAGVDFPAGPVRLTFAGRFTRGFKSVFTDRKNHNETLSIYFTVSKARKQ